MLRSAHRKERVSVTLNPEVLAAVDRWSKLEKIKSRSAAIERLVSDFMARLQREKLEAEMEVYYSSLSQADTKERQDWAEFSTFQALSRFEE